MRWMYNAGHWYQYKSREEGSLMKKYKKKCIMLVSLVLCFVMFSLIVYATTKKSVMDYFFSQEENSSVRDLNKQDIQTIEIDDYTISMIDLIYESSTKVGYCVFDVEKKNGKPEVELNRTNQMVGGRFGETEKGAKRFEIFIEASHSETTYVEQEENKLYIYYRFIIDSEFDNKIQIIDYQEKDKQSITGHKSYSFELTNNEKVVEFVSKDDAEIKISPLALVINSKKKIEEFEITFIYKDGKKDEVVNTKENIGTGASGTIADENGYQYEFIFKNVIDIDNIAYIEFNNENIGK